MCVAGHPDDTVCAESLGVNIRKIRLLEEPSFFTLALHSIDSPTIGWKFSLILRLCLYREHYQLSETLEVLLSK